MHGDLSVPIRPRSGPDAATWTDALPRRRAQLAAAWDLTLEAPYTSRVIACRRADGTPAVLKLSPDAHLIAAEADALALWAGTGVTPALLERADDALLLERIEPGTRVLDGGVIPGAADVAALVAPLHRRAPDGRFPALHERLTVTFGLATRRGLDPGLLERGLAACLELAGAGAPATLLHGDLHGANVLLDGCGRLVAIDPRPCVGDPAFDLVGWVLAGDGDPRERAEELAAAAGLDAERLLAWTRATAVLS